jgi:hypothetical protein
MLTILTLFFVSTSFAIMVLRRSRQSSHKV